MENKPSSLKKGLKVQNKCSISSRSTKENAENNFILTLQVALPSLSTGLPLSFP
jgi:hypothetical protein